MKTITEDYVSFEKQGEQNPAWSEEDEKFFKTALWHISYSISNGKSTDIHCDTTDWFKSLKDRVQPKQKSAWSEDDENMLRRAIIAIEYLGALKSDDEQYYHDISDFLKSLRHRNTWKPTYEQLEALWAVTEKNLESDNKGVRELRGNVLETLYNDLKKLG